MILGGSWLLTSLFGESFNPYTGLIWPFGVSQLLYAGSFAFTVLLTAERRGRELFAIGLVGGVTTVIFPSALALRSGVTGAAWGLTLRIGCRIHSGRVARGACADGTAPRTRSSLPWSKIDPV